MEATATTRFSAATATIRSRATVPSSGADTLTGGAGSDTFSWSGGALSTSPPKIWSPTLRERALLAATSSYYPIPPGGAASSLKALSRRCRRSVPRLGFGGNGFTEVFYASSGSDTVLFADSNDNGVFDDADFAVRITGHQNLVRADFGATAFVTRLTNGSDTFTGGADNDTIFGLGGSDTISGGGGNDTIDGGDGSDTLNGNAGDDRLTGGNGTDTLNGDDGNDRLIGGNGTDTLNGGNGRDQITGDDGMIRSTEAPATTRCFPAATARQCLRRRRQRYARRGCG